MMVVGSVAAPVPTSNPASEGQGDVFAVLRHATARWAARGTWPRLASGVAALDGVLGGGWPVGAVGEIVGPLASGRTAVAVATVAAATARGEVAAWVETGDAFDPATAQRSGVVLERVLWVRTDGVERAVRAAEIILETGGIAVVTIDLTAAQEHDWGRCGRASRSEGGGVGERPGEVTRPSPAVGVRHNALALRLGRAVERAGAVALVVADRPWSGGQAGTRLALQRGTVLWGGEEGAPRWFAGLAVRLTVHRSSTPSVGGTELRVVWEEVRPGTEPSRPRTSLRTPAR